MITIENLTKVYQTEEIETVALDKISLQIAEGEFTAIMGPSGCGKSTLLNLIGLLDTPSEGKMHFLKQEISGFSEKQRTILRKNNIGFVFQSFNLIDELTVYENIELPLLYQKVPAGERRIRVNQLIDQLGIGHRKHHFPQKLSGGQQQRVAVARAIIHQPRLILADEPTGNLDSKHGEEVMELLKKLNSEGTTIVMVTHSPSHAAYANRIINLYDGNIVAENINKLL